MEIEIWKTIEEYPDYMISNLGRVKSLKYHNTKEERILKQEITINGYFRVNLCKDKKQKRFLVHRLVAQAFIPNPQNLPCVNHRDENPSNNCLNNLEWCSYQYNNSYATKPERISKALKGKPNLAISKPILQFNREGTKIIGKWDSLSQASKELNINCPHISNVCNGKRNSAGKYKWKYLSDYINEQIQYLNELKAYRDRLNDILKKAS